MTGPDKINETGVKAKLDTRGADRERKREGVSRETNERTDERTSESRAAKFIWFSFKSPHLAFMYSVILHFF